MALTNLAPTYSKPSEQIIIYKRKDENVPQNRKVMLPKKKSIKFGIWELAFILQAKTTNKSKNTMNLRKVTKKD